MHSFLKKVLRIAVILKAIDVPLNSEIEDKFNHKEWLDESLLNEITRINKALTSHAFSIDVKVYSRAVKLAEYFFRKHLTLLGMKFDSNDSIESIITNLKFN